LPCAKSTTEIVVGLGMIGLDKQHALVGASRVCELVVPLEGDGFGKELRGRIGDCAAR